MKVTSYLKRFQLWRFRWHFLIALLAIVTIVGGIVADATGDEYLLKISQRVGGAAFWIAFFAFLLTNREMTKSLKELGEKQDNTAEMISRNNNLLSQIAQAAKLSDAARSIAFRDAERMELAEAVIAKLHQHEFDITFAMIEAMSRQPEYRTLALQLKSTAERYRDATEKERIADSVAHVIKLGQEYRWAQAYRAAENLVKAYPQSEDAVAVRRKLKQIKDGRKKELLAMWDEAVKTKDTERSLEILKDLDQYLTPSEGLALQDAASTVFKTRLHNLGVRFSLAVTENQWLGALETGEQIIRDFPNSRMAHEIRSKLDILRERAKQEHSSESKARSAAGVGTAVKDNEGAVE